MGENNYPNDPLGAQPQPFGVGQRQKQSENVSSQKPLRKAYEFTPDEMRVINETGREALMYRSLPLAGLAALAVHTAVKNGYLKPNAKFGAVPKMIGAGFAGFIIGKWSYMGVCVERLMKLPNSQLGAMLRAKKSNASGSFYENLTQDPSFSSGLALTPFQSVTDVNTDEYQQSGSLNMDTERPTYSGLDDNFRPSLDGNIVEQNLNQELNIQPAKPGVTYDELRRQNREKYSQENRIPFYQPKSAPREEIPAPGPSTGAQNKYGDSWS